MNSHPESRSNDSSSNHRSIAGITSEYFSIRVAINRYFSPIWSFYIKTDQWEKRHNNNEHNTMKRERQREKKNHKHMHTEWFVIHHIIQRIPAQEHHQQHTHTKHTGSGRRANTRGCPRVVRHSLHTHHTVHRRGTCWGAKQAKQPKNTPSITQHTIQPATNITIMCVSKAGFTNARVHIYAQHRIVVM